MDRIRPQRRKPRLPRTNSVRCAATLCLVAALARAGSPNVAHVHNFGQVSDQIYRGAEPSAAALKELKASGVNLVLDLRETGQGTSEERNGAVSLGMRYVNIPLRPWSALTSEQAREVLWQLIGHPQERIFIHCRRGKDRTGTAIACYRVQHDKWSNARALEEADSFGMSHLERAMRSFILAFSPLPDATFAQSVPGPLPLTASHP